MNERMNEIVSVVVCRSFRRLRHSISSLGSVIHSIIRLSSLAETGSRVQLRMILFSE